MKIQISRNNTKDAVRFVGQISHYVNSFIVASIYYFNISELLFNQYDLIYYSLYVQANKYRQHFIDHKCFNFCFRAPLKHLARLSCEEVAKLLDEKKSQNDILLLSIRIFVRYA